MDIPGATTSSYPTTVVGTYNVVVKNEMDKPSKLLETVAHAIAEQTLKTFDEAVAVEVKIAKFNPPIGGVCKKASVVVTKNRTSTML